MQQENLTGEKQKLQRTVREEASLINDAVLEKVGGHTERGPSWVNGKDAIREMKKAGFGSWKEVEWPGYYVKWVIQDAIQTGFLSGFEPKVEQKHYMAEGNHLWDVRTTDSESETTILTDCSRWDDLIAEFGGIGLIVFVVEYQKDTDGEFWEWQVKFGGGKSDYVEERIARGAPRRVRKTHFTIWNSFAFYFDRNLMDNCLKQGWMTEIGRNMRNADGSPRNPKYLFHWGDAPGDILLGVRPFSWDPDDVDRAFDGHSIL